MDRFEFAVRRRDLPRLDALRLRLGSDFWPEAAFAVFRSAAEATLTSGEDIRIPVSIRKSARRHKLPHLCCPRLFCASIALAQSDPAPEIVDYLNDLAELFGLGSAEIAALALIAMWAGNPNCWPGAPRIGDAP